MNDPTTTNDSMPDLLNKTWSTIPSCSKDGESGHVGNVPHVIQQATNCEARAEDISLLAAGGLTPQEEQEVRAHLATCDACRERFEQLQSVCSELRAAKPECDAVRFDLSAVASDQELVRNKLAIEDDSSIDRYVEIRAKTPLAPMGRGAGGEGQLQSDRVPRSPSPLTPLPKGARGTDSSSEFLNPTINSRAPQASLGRAIKQETREPEAKPSPQRHLGLIAAVVASVLVMLGLLSITGRRPASESPLRVIDVAQDSPTQSVPSEPTKQPTLLALRQAAAESDEALDRLMAQTSVPMFSQPLNAQSLWVEQ